MGSRGWTPLKQLTCPYCGNVLPITEGEIFPEHCSSCMRSLYNKLCADHFDNQLGGTSLSEDTDE